MAAPTVDVETTPPDSLSFTGPFTDPKTCDLTIKNVDDKKIAFKVKCTNNARFKLRPVMGLLGPKETTTVKVTCQPFDYESVKSKKERIVVLHIHCKPEANKAKEAWVGAGEPRRKNLPVTFVPGGKGAGKGAKSTKSGMGGAPKSAKVGPSTKSVLKTAPTAKPA